jgi:hypothetical protein
MIQSYSSHTCFRLLSPSLDLPSGAACHRDLRARNPADQGERQLMLDRQSSHTVDFREAVGCCNKPYRPFLPWWTGSRLSREDTVQMSKQATSQNLGSPALRTSVSSGGITPRGTTLKLLYEPTFAMASIHDFGETVKAFHAGVPLSPLDKTGRTSFVLFPQSSRSTSSFYLRFSSC